MGGGAVFTEAGWCQPHDKNVLIWHQPASIGICFPALFSFAQILWYTIVHNEISLFNMLSNLASICMIFVDPQQRVNNDSTENQNKEVISEFSVDEKKVIH